MVNNVVEYVSQEGRRMSIPCYSNSADAHVAMLCCSPIQPVKKCRVMTESYQEALSRFIGKPVVCRMLLGTDCFETCEGILVEVGPSYFTLQDPCTGKLTTCDLFCLKFFTVDGQEEPNA